MARTRFSIISALLVFLVSMCLAAVSTAAVSGAEYWFKAPPDGSAPVSGLVSDGAGNFYGTTASGGLKNCPNQSYCGTVYRVSVGANGSLSESVIFEFTGTTAGFHVSSGVALDPVGNLYGTMLQGGSEGWGTVFKLAPNGNGTWTETILYNFQGGTDGALPDTTLVQDSTGNLYGATSGGGVCSTSNQCGGVVYELSPQQSGTWLKTTLYAFPLNSQGEPSAQYCSNLVFDHAGNLYGVTQFGGSAGYGTAFQLTLNVDGNWTENVLYNFSDGLDGGQPNGGVIFDAAGDLYGEAETGGSFACPRTGCGTIFRLTPQSNGTWAFSLAHTFNGLNDSKGEYPYGGLAVDGSGNLYGTTAQGGNLACALAPGYGCGTIFELTPTSNGTTFKILAAFDGKHGLGPLTGVIPDSDRNLWGTTTDGGNLNCQTGNGNGCGVVFELTP